jgi:nicotinamide-nucleotide amidase
MKAEIVSVGTEMLLGMIVDTNAQYLTQELADLGIDVFWISQVGDNLDRVVDVLRRGLGRSDVIVVTGGLGPTEDDLTRESIAAALDETIAVDPELERWLRENFARRGRPMPERNIKQATLIPSARSLPNPIGTAPGWWVERGGTIIVAMPGVPTEMRRMWEEQARPRLRERSGAGVLVTTALKCLGLGEAAVEEQLGDLIHGTNPTVATYAKPDGVQVRISAKANSEDVARALLQPTVDQVMHIFGDWIYGRDDETLAGIAATLLNQRQWSITSAERGTAGALAAEITIDEGLSARYRGGFMVAADGGPLGLESAEPAELARAARERTGADVGIAAVLGSFNGRPAADFAVVVRNEVRSDSTRWNLGIPELRRRAAVEALALLVRTLREGA